ncbi:cupin domain-containing protein, partial [Escherichia coli]|nr:cupin domain-containing protein [Escherichia coli]
AYSAWHRIQSDELWHFHSGDSLNVHGLEVDGTMSTHRLAPAAEDARAVYQAGVPPARWLAAERVRGEHGYALAGGTVAPGFKFSEFELADDSALLAKYSAHGDLIRRLLPRPALR